MNIIKKLLKRLILLACSKEIIRTHLLNELSQHHADELIAEVSKNHANAFMHSYADVLLPLLAETLHQRNITNQEAGYLAYAANAVLHHGQEGEDIILERMLSEQENGFFVDVGAHHPTRFSNTYALYRRGWRGINIDATPGSMAVFAQWRPEDINIETAVSDTVEPMAFHMFKEPALNTFDASLAESYIQAGWERLGTRDVTPRPLADILDGHLPPGMNIDLMSIDVEGEEMGVLRSNNWEKYAPRYLVLEILGTQLIEIMHAPAIIFLRERGYVPISKLAQTVILQRQ
ncbi:MAG: FkbM family methyltransferase [Desulfovibrionaceae bacterium]|nr:FkbM family methyltransferase [Desulfovibrionaceae bacterium]